MTVDPAVKQLEKCISDIAYAHSPWQVFADFVEMSALAISNSVDKLHYDEREKRYLDIISKYKQNEQMLFSEMFALLVEALDNCAREKRFEDILGQIFHNLELHNKYKGQFFTPMGICNMMGKMAVGDSLENKIKEKGYITIAEPACGSGAMVLGAINAFIDNRLDWSKQMFVSAVDIDLKCVHMAYVQLSLYGMPAVVTWGNTLMVEEWSRWYTPVYMINGWFWRETGSMLAGRNQEVELFKMADQPLYRAFMTIRGDIVDIEAGTDDTIQTVDESTEDVTDSLQNVSESTKTVFEFKADNQGQLMLF